MAKDDKRMLKKGDMFSLVNHGTCDRDTKPDLRPFAAWTFSVKNETASVVPDSTRSKTAPLDDDTCEGRTVTPEWVAERWDTRTVLGRGNFSEVHLGLKVKDHINDDQKYAVKVIDIKTFIMFQNKRESHLDLTSEAKALKALQHDGIIRIYDFFQTEEKFYLIMEYVPAGDLLRSIVDDGCFSEYQARRFFRQLCEAVEYLHKQDFIHRDLKPDNILLTTRDRDNMKMKIADFGLARKTLKTRDCQTFCGTPQYFAPEVINTFKEKDSGMSAGYDKPADMWSLGVILYIMLSGVPPFEEDDLYEQILEGKYEFDVDEWNPISIEAKGLVRKLMTVNPKERLTISQALEYIQKRWLMAREPASPQRRPKVLEQLGEVRTAKRRRTGDGFEGTD
jgi:serine/threonine protein kinase